LENKNEEVILFSPQIETFTPFASYTDPSRLNMASKQQLQTVIGQYTDTPIVIDKHYQKITKMNSPFIEFAPEDGHILLADDETLIIYYPELKKLITKSTPPVKKLINNALSLKYRVDVGPIKKGELLFDYTHVNTKNLLPRIGHRANILFSSFFGYTADDAMVISESFSKKATIEYSQKVFIPITKEWKYLRNPLDNFFYSKAQTLMDEAYIQYFPIDAGDHFMAEIHNVSEQPSMFFTKNIAGIKHGQVVSVKVHKNTEKSFQELKGEYIYTPGLIDEIEDFYKDNYKTYLNAKYIFDQLGIDKEESVKLAEELFHNYYSVPKFTKDFTTKLKDEFQLEADNVDFLLEVTISKEVKTTRGDKFTNLFAGKGTVSMIIPDTLMPKDPQTGEPVDIIFNPLGIFGRNNWGVLFELALSKVAKDIELIAKKTLVNDEVQLDKANAILARISFVAENFIKDYDTEYYNKITEHLLPGIKSAMVHENFEPIKELVEDINTNGFYLFAPNFPNIKYTDFYHNFVEPYGKQFNVEFGKTTVTLDQPLIDWLRDNWNYKNEVLGDDTYGTEIEAFVGSNYMLKLYHTSYSKFTTVSLANSYSKITGQPVRGRKKFGGQHISWQTLAALLGHKENNGILKELYTIKSDAPIKDKEKFLIQYITKGEYNLKPKYVSLTKRAVNNALKILGMQFEE
jgi:DNA-directed RNA polymerase beta subunit